MADSRHGAIFADNFMRGFSFVDAIEQRKKSDARLETRLAEEKEERAFQRRRTLEADQQVRDDRAYTTGERARIEDERGKREQGEQAALNPDASDEDLMPFVAFSPSARAEMERRIGKERVAEALRGAQSIPGGVGAAASNQVTSTPTRPSLSEAVAAGGDPIVDPASAAAEPGQSQFAPSQGPSNLKQVSEEDISFFDPEFQEKGFAAQVGDVVGGQFQQLSRGVGNIVESGARLRSVPGVIPGPRAAGAAFSGESFVPSSFVSKADFDQIADPAERQAVKESNAKIIQDQKAAARNPNRNTLSRPITRQGAVQEGGELARDNAQRAQNAVLNKYSEFLEGEGGALETAALEDPSVAAVDYFESRATLLEAGGEGMVAAVDKRMIPVLDAYSAEISAELSQQQPGSASARRLGAKYRNVQASRNQIAKDQPSINPQAGVNSSGLKVGDTQRAQDVTETIYSPERVSPHSVAPGAINTAATIASRISPNKRLNAAQTDALATLAEAGWMDKNTAMTVMMTGQWPPGTNPDAIKKTIKSGETTYAITEGGGFFILPDPTGAANKRKDANAVSRDIGTDQLDWVSAGAATMGVPEDRIPQVHGLMSDHAGWIRKHYNVTSQESMIAAGRALGQAVFLSAQEHKRMANDGWYKFTEEKNAPTPEEVFLNPVLREKLAEEYNAKPVPMPAVGERGDLDLEPFKASLREGVHGPSLQADADQMNDEQLLYVYWTLNATPEDIAAANQQGE